MVTISACDPGNSGAFAFLDVAKCKMNIFDMPTFEFTTTKNRTEIDPYTISAMMCEFKPYHLYLEEVFSSPQMGVTSAFNFGQGKGMIRGVAAALNIPLTHVKPTKWKKDMKVPADKKAAVMRAAQLFPGSLQHFQGKRGGVLDGRAEAALICLYAAMELGSAPKGVIDVSIGY